MDGLGVEVGGIDVVMSKRRDVEDAEDEVVVGELVGEAVGKAKQMAEIGDENEVGLEDNPVMWQEAALDGEPIVWGGAW